MLSYLPKEIFEELAQFYMRAATPPPPLNAGLALRLRDRNEPESEERAKQNMQLPKQFLDVGYMPFWNERVGTRYFDAGVAPTKNGRVALYRWRRAVCPHCLAVVNDYDLMRTRIEPKQHCKRCHHKNHCGGKRKRV